MTHSQYTITGRYLKLLVAMQTYGQTFMTYSVTVNRNSNLRNLQLTYLAVDTSFSPPFSMNRFFPVVIL